MSGRPPARPGLGSRALEGSHERAAHEQCLALAPWWINGTADARERRRVEQHLSVCESCRKEVEMLRRIDAELHFETAAVTPHPARFEALMARAESGPVSLLVRLRRGELWRDRAALVWWAMSAQSVVIVVLLSLLALHRWAPQTTEELDPEFRTLSSAKETSSALERELRVVFASGTSAEEIDVLAKALGARVIAGPTSLGVYTLQILDLDHERAQEPAPSQTVLSDAERVSRWRRDPRVRFVSPIGVDP